MAGVLLHLVPRTKYDFSNLTASQVQEILVAKAIEAVSSREISVIVKVHAISFGGTQTIKVILRAESPSGDDPSNDYVLGTSASAPTDLASVSISSSTTAPVMLIASISTPPAANTNQYYGSHVRVIVQGTQAGSATAFSATISIDMTQKA